MLVTNMICSNAKCKKNRILRGNDSIKECFFCKKSALHAECLLHYLALKNDYEESEIVDEDLEMLEKFMSGSSMKFICDTCEKVQNMVNEIIGGSTEESAMMKKIGMTSMISSFTQELMNRYEKTSVNNKSEDMSVLRQKENIEAVEKDSFLILKDEFLKSECPRHEIDEIMIAEKKYIASKSENLNEGDIINEVTFNENEQSAYTGMNYDTKNIYSILSEECEEKKKKCKMKMKIKNDEIQINDDQAKNYNVKNLTIPREHEKIDKFKESLTQATLSENMSDNVCEERKKKCRKKKKTKNVKMQLNNDLELMRPYAIKYDEIAKDQESLIERYSHNYRSNKESGNDDAKIQESKINKDDANLDENYFSNDDDESSTEIEIYLESDNVEKLYQVVKVISKLHRGKINIFI